ncbi:MAG TPA: hypothetical protein DEB17_08070 [Chlorobaculum sp.]|uniref:Uncharacterized protein n=1 Tax=Chlorobaculum tepidum (strain ATCC 49652 / DSM 12025 / NBRC 103806 / TLS) TaxID=194439 RepID=Q8KD54_CHLTE|nr:hypothetical protein CT1200 [Chlorobaculum tepidum TLS]HBU23927.1 hypothetical protein [Chlorobaculum sp.]
MMNVQKQSYVFVLTRASIVILNVSSCPVFRNIHGLNLPLACF